MIRALLLLVAVLAAALGWSLWRAETHKGAAVAAVERAQGAEAALAQTQAALAEEREMARRMAGIAADYERERQDAQAEADRLVADLVAGNVSLHRRWQACDATARVSAAATAPSFADGGADDRNESAGRIVRAAAECDAQVRGLQAVIRADRERVSK